MTASANWRRTVRHQLGRRALQSLWERLHGVCLNGLNIGSATRPMETNGEAAALAWIAARLDQGRSPVCLDVGANVGAYCEGILRAMPSAEVHAFEPGKAAFTELRSRLGGRSGVHLHNLAVGSEAGTATLYSDDSKSVFASTFRTAAEGDGARTVAAEAVTVTSLDSFCAAHGIDQVALLKVDVEGGELDVLNGARELVAVGAIRFIQWEFGTGQLAARSYLKDFFDLLGPAYEIHRVLIDGLTPMTYHPKWEIFSSETNYLAVARRLL